jgi:ribosome recycling factor
MSGKFGQLEQECKSAIEHFKREAARMRSGRANPALLEGIMVDYYGASAPIKQLGLVSAPEARLLTIQVYDPSAAESVEKAIRNSELSLNPSRDGTLIRVNIPALSEERRKDLVKTLHRMAEEAKVGLRNHRRDAIDALKKQVKAKEISEDDQHHGQEEIQKITDRYSKDVDALLVSKEKEMMEV